MTARAVQLYFGFTLAVNSLQRCCFRTIICLRIVLFVCLLFSWHNVKHTKVKLKLLSFFCLQSHQYKFDRCSCSVSLKKKKVKNLQNYKGNNWNIEEKCEHNEEIFAINRILMQDTATGVNRWRTRNLITFNSQFHSFFFFFLALMLMTSMNDGRWKVLPDYQPDDQKKTKNFINLLQNTSFVAQCIFSTHILPYIKLPYQTKLIDG